MEYIKVDHENIEDEHICCAFSDKKCVNGYYLKKEWLKKQFDDGYVYQKLDARAKVFIEYGPAEKVWLPINAPNYNYISCFWVSGRYKGQGHGKDLLHQCIDESKAEGKSGLCIITSDKKRSFMNDPKFLKLNGFEKSDSASPYFELWSLKFDENTEDPKFFDSAKTGKINDNGITIYYSNACPFTEYYVNTELKKFANDHKIPINIVKINSKSDADKLPVPWMIYSLFYNGEFLSHDIKSYKGLEKVFTKYLNKN